MLSVGREINVRASEVCCRKCEWEGTGDQLSTGLIRINHTTIRVYAYRCPSCGSFRVARKGKLLGFRSPQMPGAATIRERNRHKG